MTRSRRSALRACATGFTLAFDSCASNAANEGDVTATSEATDGKTTEGTTTETTRSMSGPPYPISIGVWNRDDTNHAVLVRVAPPDGTPILDRTAEVAAAESVEFEERISNSEEGEVA